MARNRRSRRTLKWLATLACVLVLGLWAASMRWFLLFDSPRSSLLITHGTVGLVWWSMPFNGYDRGWTAIAHTAASHRTFGGLAPKWPSIKRRRLDNGVQMHLPLWLPAAVFGLAAGWSWYRRPRPIKPGRCRCCGYDLRATPRCCPECGTRPGVESR